MSLARSLHALTCRGRESLRDADLVALADELPDAQAVLEELQFLRDDADSWYAGQAMLSEA